MSIVFGLGSLKLKSFTPEELKIQDLVPANSSIELRNKYFHLFWIPLFPVRKVWVINLAGKHYSVSEEAAKAIETKKHLKRTPFYLFSGLILLIGAAVVIGGWNSLLKQKGINHTRSMIKKDIEAINKKIEETDTSDFFLFTQISIPDKSCLMKVIAVKGDLIQFRKKNIKLKAEQVDSVKLSYMVGSFDNGGDTLLIKKDAIKRSYKSPYSMSFGFKGEDLLQDGELYKLWSIYKLKR
jgi:hypothetical protein